MTLEEMLNEVLNPDRLNKVLNEIRREEQAVPEDLTLNMSRATNTIKLYMFDEEMRREIYDNTMDMDPALH